HPTILSRRNTRTRLSCPNRFAPKAPSFRRKPESSVVFTKKESVIPAQAGIQTIQCRLNAILDSGGSRNDGGFFGKVILLRFRFTVSRAAAHSSPPPRTWRFPP